ncbi:DNA ligase D [Bacillus chungangensis]|uniref:DNA ligase D n=1 Tax=Bacillus chungangensis TaxID=587633 RepID=UPI0027D909AA|nr:DNA ligase D [Bacillus chungangensis]
MKPMLPILKQSLPQKEKWGYEVKYDGYRGMLEWTEEKMHLWSRNERDLLPQFPELAAFLLQLRPKAASYFPLLLDGELVLLEHGCKANFQQLQIRGRMKTDSRIKKQAQQRPCCFLAFDLLQQSGKNLWKKPYHDRKQLLQNLLAEWGLPLTPTIGVEALLHYVPYDKSSTNIWEMIQASDGEGMVAKQLNSKWEEGKRSEAWIKLKNWKTASCFITAYSKENGYYEIGVYQNNQIIILGQFLFSLPPESKGALQTIIQENAHTQNGSTLLISPAICVDVFYLEWYEGQLREPHFHTFRFDLTPDDCTFEQFLIQEASLPQEVTITHPDKPLWKHDAITKLDYVRYLRKVSPYMLPFLHDRLLTLIRYPHGIFGEGFYQKNCPDYAPSFVKTHQEGDIEYILCNDLRTFIWLGNQLAIEFHLPFQTIESHFVSEIVFDLDPPSRDKFQLAVQAAQMMKEIFDQLLLKSFVKTSGNKGLQVYIPLPDNQFTWEDTRKFTSFITQYLVTKEPTLFTTERLKKNRKGKLYLDYLQHGEGKTIIAPYSVRGNEEALVAAPLFWDEVNEKLHPNMFTIKTVLQRLHKMGCPFAAYMTAKKDQPFANVLEIMHAT